MRHYTFNSFILPGYTFAWLSGIWAFLQIHYMVVMTDFLLHPYPKTLQHSCCKENIYISLDLVKISAKTLCFKYNFLILFNVLSMYNFIQYTMYIVYLLYFGCVFLYHFGREQLPTTSSICTLLNALHIHVYTLARINTFTNELNKISVSQYLRSDVNIQ